MSSTVPSSVSDLVARFDPSVFELGRPRARLRLEGTGPEPVEVLLEGHTARVVTRRGRPDAVLSAEPDTWAEILDGSLPALRAFGRRRLRIRHDLHLGVGFLAATAGQGAGGLRIRRIQTSTGSLSVAAAGTGAPTLLLHGLGGTKASFLSTVAALAPHRRAIAVDLPGFGDSVKPLRAAYDPPYFAGTIVALLDALNIERADLVGNSMGGRIALELGLSHPNRVNRLALLAPSLAWLRDRPWAAPLKLVVPQLGLIQPAPRALVERIVAQVVPGGDDEWTAAGVDEFLRAYLTPRGRSAFYTAARNIYLEAPHGPDGFWTRLPSLQAPSLFIWGERDTLVPMRFARHVRDALPSAEQLELPCGHLPQLEQPAATHAAILAHFSGEPPA